MTRTWNMILNNDDRLTKMLSDSLSIYDQALYYQRQAYFETKSKGKIKTHSNYELWDLVKKDNAVLDSKMDINIKQQIVKQVYNNWKSFIKSAISFKNKPSLFKGRPKMPNYLYKTKDWNIIYIDKTRFRKKNGETNSFCLPCSDYKVNIPKQINLKNIRQISVQKFYGKIKINIIYEDKNIKQYEYDSNSSIGIDIGVNNLMAITSNDKSFSYIVNGCPLKSINQFYNKKLSELKSELDIKNKTKISKAIQRLAFKRNNKINHYIHCCSKMIIDLCVKNKIESIIIGHNKGWKQESNMGKKANQNFVQIPFNMLIEQIKYKSEKYIGLKVDIVEESYTSKIDHLVFEDMKHQKDYLGKRINRGLYKSSCGKLLNADINGSIGILRKGNAITDDQILVLRDRGDVVSPKMLVINS